ncbi:MAG: hypothetical protein JST00_18590 [Deltaproteobacteria bacterium]|nr:hypothetical protein [Deltaproteobacteria bacterium]
MALRARGLGKAPSRSGEYVVVRPSRDADAVPTGRYGAAPESRRVLDEYDFDVPSRQPLELEDEAERRSSFDPPIPASVPRPLEPSRSTGATAPAPRGAAASLFIATCILLGGALLIAAVGVVMALISHG